MTAPSRVLATAILASLLAWGAAGAGPPETPDDLLARARAVYESEGPAPALPLFENALAAYRAAGDRRGEAITLGLVGNCHKRLGDLDRALSLLTQALASKRELDDRLETGKTLSHLGLVHWERAEYPEAIRCLEEAVAIGQETGEAKLTGSALNNLGLVHDELGEYATSLGLYRRALAAYRGADFPRGEGDTLGNLGGVQLLLGRYREAMGYYRQALAVSRRIDSRAATSQDIGNIALCHAGLGEVDEALADFDRAVELARAAGLAKEEADWLRGKGALLVEAGRHDEGLALLGAALARYEAAGLQRERVEALQELSLLHLELGDVVGAEASLSRSLEVARRIGHSRGVLSGLIALAELERRRQRPEQAAALLDEALDGARKAGDKGLEASCHTLLSAVLLDREKPGTARDEARRGAEVARGEGARLLEAEALFAAGEAGRRLGNTAGALEDLAAGERLLDGLGEPDVAWRLAHARGRALEAMGRDDEALVSYRLAVRRIETVRSRLRQERFRAGYIEERHEAYVDLVRLLLHLGRDDEAFSAAERLRARSYLDILSRGLDAGLTEAQQRRAAAGMRQRIQLLQRSLDAEVREPGRARRQAVALFSSELASAEREYEAFLEDLRATDPALAAAWSLAVPDTALVRATLPADAALVEYVVGPDEVMAFVLTRERLATRVVALPRRDLESKVALVRDLVARRGDGWRAPAASLAGFLLDPVEKTGGLAGRRRLLVVPHGVLQQLPFALLPHGRAGRPLVSDFEVTLLPAAGSLVLPRGARSPRGTVLAVAPSRAHLRHAAAEATAVVGAHAEPRLLLVGQAATESAVKAAAPGYRVLHLATHGRWNRLNPLLSSLELEPSGTDDGHLEVHEVLGLRLDASLVTLSACETALGSDLLGSVPAGDDFVGLTRAFLHAGSDAVLASLWEVDDRSTLELMRAFYARAGGAGPAAALAEAQRALLSSPREDLSHPYHWAAFVLVGDRPLPRPSTTVSSVSVKAR